MHALATKKETRRLAENVCLGTRLLKVCSTGLEQNGLLLARQPSFLIHRVPIGGNCNIALFLKDFWRSGES
jgi:hypothetical protein